MVAESLDSKDKNRRHRLPITPPLAKFNKLVQKYARMVELVDTRDLKSLGLNSCAGSSPALRTKYRFFRNCRLKERLFHLYFLIPATGKNRSPPPFEKRFFELAPVGVWVMVLLCKNRFEPKISASTAFCPSKSSDPNK